MERARRAQRSGRGHGHGHKQAMAVVMAMVTAMATTMATAMGAATPPRPPAPEFNVEVIWRHAMALQTPSASLGAQQTPQQEQHNAARNH